MKKISIVSAVSFLFLFLCSVTAKLSGLIFTAEFILPLVIGIAILLFSGIGALIVQENIKGNTVCFFINAVGMGFIIRSWYILRGLENPIYIMALISLACVVYLWCFFAIFRIPFIRKSRAASLMTAVLLLALSLTVYILLVVKTKTTFVSTLGYYMLIELAFIYAMSLSASTKNELIRNLTLSTYSVFAVAFIVIVFAVLALLGGDGCDCDGDCGCCGDGECCECLDGADITADIGAGKKKNKKP